jgi:small subunit ribosomal protein S20
MGTQGDIVLPPPLPCPGHFVFRSRVNREQPHVANIKSQIKRNKQNLVRNERNKAVRSEIRSRSKSAIAAAAAGADDADERLRLAIKRLDKAAAKGVIHRNAAARRKSRLVAQARRGAAKS